jgi:EpsD family peptidyl-prolyl cis-trans isomerase
VTESQIVRSDHAGRSAMNSARVFWAVSQTFVGARQPASRSERARNRPANPPLANSANMVRTLFSISILVAILLALCSCARDEKKASGQVAAKVNGEEISAQQIYDAIARGGGVPPAQSKQAAARILERIIEQELLVQGALEAKLDRDPNVAQAIKSAKREVLGQAYIAKVISTVGRSSGEEIEAFYRQNPALFERRRIYRTVELAVVAPAEQLGALKAATAGTTRLDDVEGWLKSHKLPFQVVTSGKPAEQIPMNILAHVSEMRDGQIGVFTTPRGASVVQLVQSEAVPLSEQQAMSVIERYLLNRERLSVAQAEVKKLRERAKIEYGAGFEPPLVTAPHLTAAAAPGARTRPPAVVAHRAKTSMEVVTSGETRIP